MAPPKAAGQVVGRDSCKGDPPIRGQNNRKYVLVRLYNGKKKKTTRAYARVRTEKP